MTWFDYVLLGLWAFTSLVTVGTVGRERKPLDPSTAVVTLVINGLLVIGLLFSRGVLS